MTERHNCAEEVARTLQRLMKEDETHCVVVNDSSESHHAGRIRDAYPERFIDVGIAEQNMVGIAAGLANSGLTPWVFSAASFLTARALEQIRNDVAYHNLNIKLCGFISGLSYGELGATHHSLEDLAWIRSIPNIRVVAPSDHFETRAAVEAMAKSPGPTYLRVVSRTGITPIFSDGHVFEFGRACILRDGSDVCLFGHGRLTAELLKASELLRSHGISARVVNLSSIKPCDRDVIIAAARETRRIVVAEEHRRAGGAFGMIAEELTELFPTPGLSICVPDNYSPNGAADYLFRYHRLDAASIAERVREWLDECSRQVVQPRGRVSRFGEVC
jgi:transketolase